MLLKIQCHTLTLKTISNKAPKASSNKMQKKKTTALNLKSVTEDLKIAQTNGRRNSTGIAEEISKKLQEPLPNQGIIE